jgi:hypothetical protein
LHNGAFYYHKTKKYIDIVKVTVLTYESRTEKLCINYSKKVLTEIKDYVNIIFVAALRSDE